MRSVTYRLVDLQLVEINLGFVGENKHTKIIFDCKKMFDQYPNAIASLSVTPPNGDSYPAITTREGDFVFWEVTASDLVHDGSGKIQLAFIENEKVAKTYECKTKIYPSIIPNGNPPTGIENFIEQANVALQEIPLTIDSALQEAKDSGEFNGFSPIATVTKSGDATVIQITDVNGTTQATIYDGGSSQNVIDDNSGIGDKKTTWSADKLAKTIPVKMSQLTNDSGFIATETDPTVPAWAKTPNKPTYTAQEVGALPVDTPIPDISGKADKANTVLTDTLSKGRVPNSTVGDGSIAYGSFVVASGANSVAFGAGTQATNSQSYAEGGGTQATAAQAHSEGAGTLASGVSSHAEGGGSRAIGLEAHAEGSGTEAFGASSHAEGGSTHATGSCSHAEGGGSTASGSSSHAEGNASTASGDNSHSEGYGSTASGESSHVEGKNTVATHLASHAEGQETESKAAYAHAEGYCTRATNTGSHAEGGVTEASGLFSHAEGTETTASASDAHAEGYHTSASGAQSHAEGGYSEASGTSSHAEGMSTHAIGFNAHSEGLGTIAIGQGSHAEGTGSKAEGNASHAEGVGCTASGQPSHAEGSGNVASGQNSHVEGAGNIAAGRDSHVHGTFCVTDYLRNIDEWVANTHYYEGDLVKITTIETNENMLETTTIVKGYSCVIENTDAEFDPENWVNYDKMKYAEIVGNGTGLGNRSNARALDWEGNEYIKGNIYIGCNADSTGGAIVATVNQLPAYATDTETMSIFENE